MKSRSGLVVGAVEFLIWEALCGVICFGARSYMGHPAARRGQCWCARLR